MSHHDTVLYTYVLPDATYKTHCVSHLMPTVSQSMRVSSENKIVCHMELLLKMEPTAELGHGHLQAEALATKRTRIQNP